MTLTPWSKTTDKSLEQRRKDRSKRAARARWAKTPKKRKAKMSEIKNTPGPWIPQQVVTKHYGTPDHGWGIIAVEPMRGRIDSSITGMTKADAHLIAAAPDLYEALKGALALLETDGSRHNIWHRALDKAEGRA